MPSKTIQFLLIATISLTASSCGDEQEPPQSPNGPDLRSLDRSDILSAHWLTEADRHLGLASDTQLLLQLYPAFMFTRYSVAVSGNQIHTYSSDPETIKAPSTKPLTQEQLKQLNAILQDLADEYDGADLDRGSDGIDILLSTNFNGQQTRICWWSPRDPVVLKVVNHILGLADSPCSIDNQGCIQIQKSNKLLQKAPLRDAP